MFRFMNTKGAAFVEYVILLSLIGVLSIFAVLNLGNSVSDGPRSASSALETFILADGSDDETSPPLPDSSVPSPPSLPAWPAGGGWLCTYAYAFEETGIGELTPMGPPMAVSLWFGPVGSWQGEWASPGGLPLMFPTEDTDGDGVLSTTDVVSPGMLDGPTYLGVDFLAWPDSGMGPTGWAGFSQNPIPGTLNGVDGLPTSWATNPMTLHNPAIPGCE